MAIVHAPGTNESKSESLIKTMQYFTERMNVFPDEIQVNTHSMIDVTNFEYDGIPSTLIVGWGLSNKPDWSKWDYEIKTSLAIRLFIAIDLYERDGANGRVLTAPKTEQCCHWWRKGWLTRFKRFLNGYFVSHFAPYGMKRIPRNEVCGDDSATFDYHILAPGSLQEIEIVRLIFNLFVHHGYTITEISNLLNAQGVKAPNQSGVWNIKKIRTLMTSVFYIGSNQCGACVKHNVFPALIDRSTFCEAQARLYGKERFR